MAELKLFMSTQTGREHFEGIEGPVLICPNHESHLDAPTVRSALPARLRDRLAIATAADTFFDGSPLGPVVALGQGALPFGRSTDVRASLEHVADLVNDGVIEGITDLRDESDRDGIRVVIELKRGANTDVVENADRLLDLFRDDRRHKWSRAPQGAGIFFLSGADP